MGGSLFISERVGFSRAHSPRARYDFRQRAHRSGRILPCTGAIPVRHRKFIVSPCAREGDVVTDATTTERRQGTNIERRYLTW